MNGTTLPPNQEVYVVKQLVLSHWEKMKEHECEAAPTEQCTLQLS